METIYFRLPVLVVTRSGTSPINPLLPTWQLLKRSVHIHPTYGEALPSLARLLKARSGAKQNPIASCLA